jgi:hypothetical protein
VSLIYDIPSDDWNAPRPVAARRSTNPILLGCLIVLQLLITVALCSYGYLFQMSYEGCGDGITAGPRCNFAIVSPAVGALDGIGVLLLLWSVIWTMRLAARQRPNLWVPVLATTAMIISSLAYAWVIYAATH